MTDFYSDPFIYDVLHSGGTASELRGLLRAAAKCIPTTPPLRILEPACGSGRYLIALARKGHLCTGFDLEPAMVEYARNAAVERAVEDRVKVFTADMRTFPQTAGGGQRRLERFHLAFNLINTIRHLRSDAAMVDHLRAVGSVLVERGVYMVGISLTAYGLESPTEDSWMGVRKHVRVQQVVQYIPASSPSGPGRDEQVLSHLSILDGDVEEHRDSRYLLRGYDLAQLRAVVAKAGMRIVGTFASDGEVMHEIPAFGYLLLALANEG